MSEVLYRGPADCRFFLPAGARHLVTVSADTWHENGVVQLCYFAVYAEPMPVGPPLYADGRFLFCLCGPSWWVFQNFGNSGVRCVIEALDEPENDALKAAGLLVAATARPRQLREMMIVAA